MQKALVSVTGVDKVGIIAKVSAALSENSVNILEISQTILDGYFTMLMIVDITAAENRYRELSESLAALGEQIGVSVRIQRVDIFDAMHRI